MENGFVLEGESEGGLLRDRIIKFGWGGGACSRLVGSGAEAVAGMEWKSETGFRESSCRESSLTVRIGLLYLIPARPVKPRYAHQDKSMESK